MAENSLWARELNGEADEDEALRVAIAMSLGEEFPEPEGPRPTMESQSQPHTIDLTQGVDVETASEASDVGSTVPPTENRQSPSQAVAKPTASTTTASGIGLLGLDRRQMEEERLARLGKRKAGDGAPTDAGLGGRPSQRMKTESGPPTQSFRMSDDAAAQEINQHRGTRPDESRKPNLPFPQGVVKKTWCAGQPRLGNDIKIEEVLQKDQLELAVISSFQWDPDFLLRKIDLSRTKICLISHSPDPAEQDAIRASLPPSRARFCFPAMNGPGNMHSKLQILKFEGYLRVVVPTGNFVGYDWGETGVMENVSDGCLHRMRLETGSVGRADAFLR
jgi:hypothetical protein